MRINGLYKCKKDFTNGLNVPYFKKGDLVRLEFPPTPYKDWKSSDGELIPYTEFYVSSHNGKDPLFKRGYHLAHFKGCFKKLNRYERLSELLED